jgi:hypothetical protein
MKIWLLTILDFFRFRISKVSEKGIYRRLGLLGNLITTYSSSARNSQDDSAVFILNERECNFVSIFIDCRVPSEKEHGANRKRTQVTRQEYSLNPSFF